LTRDDFESASHSGDCEDDVRSLLKLPRISSQVLAWDAESLRRELKEYGAWNETELSDHGMNIVRMLWLACGNLSDEQRDQDDDQ
jgi:hypothetical protein